MGYAQLGHAFAKLLDQRLWLAIAGQDERKFFATKAGCNIERAPGMACQC